MKHEEYRILLSGYLDGELNPDQLVKIEEHLKSCRDCQQEYKKMQKTQEVLNKMDIQKPRDEAWKAYWSSIYNQLERKTGWVFLSIGLIILLSFGIYEAFKDFFQDPSNPLILKAGAISLGLGGVILLISVIKEQVFSRKRERYKEIEK
jgi:hypothetical protein